MNELSYYPEIRFSEVKSNHVESDVEKLIEKRNKFVRNIDILKRAVMELDDPIGSSLFDSVTTGRAFPYYEARGIGCGRDYWYVRYRRLFYILDKIRE